MQYFVLNEKTISICIYFQVETDIDVCQVPDDIYTPYDIVEDRDHTDAVAEDDRHDDILGK